MRFDNEGKYIVKSYREEEIISEDKENRLIIEKVEP